VVELVELYHSPIWYRPSIMVANLSTRFLAV